MKNNSSHLLLSLLLLGALMANCERNTLELPETTETIPDIELDMLVDGNPISAMAGIGDVFNETDYFIDEEEVYTFSGALTTVDCGPDCPNSFSMRIRNLNLGVSSFDASQSIGERSYKFKNESEPLSDAFLLNLDINSQAEEPQFSWLIDGNIFTQKDLTDLRVVDRGIENEVNATLSIFDEATGLTSFYTEELHLDSDVQGVSSRIIVEHLEGDEVALSIQHTESEDFIPLAATLWTIEDLSGQNKQLFTVAQDSVIHLTIGEGKRINNITQFQVISDATTTTVGIEIKYDDNLGLIYNDADFEYQILDEIENGSALALQTFEFIMIDENGIEFSSAKGPQSSENLFEILSVEPFIENSKGQATVKVNCQFSCTLYADDGSQKEVQNAKAIIALATP